MADKKWYNVELVKDLADRFKVYLWDKGIEFEPSAADNLIHFECHMNEVEYEAANEWLRTILRK